MRRGVSSALKALLAAAWVTSAVCIPASASANGIQAAFSSLYNYDFEQAHAILDNEAKARPEDPLVPAVRGAAYLFEEFERQRILELRFFEGDDEVTDKKRLQPDPKVRERLFETTAEARRLASARLATTPDDRDALFAICTAVGTETDYMALVEKRYLKAYFRSKESQAYARRMLALDPPDDDAYLTIGTVEYVVGSMNAFFRLFIRFDQIEGDKNTAVENLERVIEHGRYYGPFAKILLAAVHLREGQPEQALELLRELAAQFPGNTLVRGEIERLAVRVAPGTARGST